MKLVKLHVDDQPLAHSKLVAYHVLVAALIGVPGDNGIGKKKVEATATATTDGSSAAKSTD